MTARASGEQPEPSSPRQAFAADISALFEQYETDSARARVDSARRAHAVPDVDDVALVEGRDDT